MQAKIIVKGIVQGIGFRPFIYRLATRYGLTGFVQNRGDAGVSIVVEGDKSRIELFLNGIELERPTFANIHKIIVKYREKNAGFSDFRIMESDREGKSYGSVIPYDISICNECLCEMRDSFNRRYEYFFITCTNCGPRYTAIKRVPYDRINTTMQDFSMCKECEREYTNPLDRRFHAQTIACHNCGPKIELKDNEGNRIECSDPIKEAGRLIEEEYIVAIKGNGGFHISASTLIDAPLERMRRAKHRAQKPFAIMARNIDAIKTFAEINDEEVEYLSSPIRPIILVKKSTGYYLSSLVSPCLYNVGVMLPYTGLQYMLFDETTEPAFVMTSANSPDEPIIINNDLAIEKLNSLVDYFLLHDREISQRCDDSVIKFVGDSMSILRRSRGYAPAPININLDNKNCVLGIGAEQNVTCCILNNKKAFLSQHIGDVETLETLNFLKDSIEHLIKLTGSNIEIIACDLHPKFITSKLAKELAEEKNLELIQAQHHFAHLAKLIGEHGINEAVGIVCDGFGFGLDGKAWGGEILYCSENIFKRLGHLEEQPMIGGDLATKFPIRMLAGILHKDEKFNEWFRNNANLLPHGMEEIDVIERQLNSKNFLMTTSCGRLLDAISALLGICYKRTYEGEPAMKLESAAFNGRDILKLEPKIERNVIRTTWAVQEIFRNLKKFSPRDLAYSIQSYVANSLGEYALLEAERLGVKNIGFTGGVAYNQHISLALRDKIEKNGYNFYLQKALPPGDGGISFGQAIYSELII